MIESCGKMEQVFLRNEEEKQRIGIDIPQLFPKLKVLILDSLPRLTTFCQGTKSSEFPLLAQMKITRCPLLEIHVSTGGWSPENGDDQSHKLAIAGKSCISQLQILSIEECEMMEHVFLHNQRNVDIKTLVFSELKSLSLKSLPGLSSLCKGIKSFEFPLLDHIQVKDCPLLESIDTISLFKEPDKVEMELWDNQPFKTSQYLSLEGDAKRNLDFRVAQNIRCLSFRECERGTKLVSVKTMDALFPNLEVLRLVTLFELEEIWDIDDGPIPNNSFKNLKELRLEFLPALNHLWKSINSPSRVNVVSIFSQLSSIYIYGCHSLRSLFTLPGTTSGSCTLQLEKLVIASCDMMEQVFLCNEGENQISIHFPKLKVLILDSLPMLTNLSKGNKSIDLPLLGHKRISRCPQLEIFDSPYHYDDQGDDDSVHLFCKPYNKEKMELRVQGNISVGNKIEECVEYMSFEGDGSRILDVDQVGQSMRCLTFRECSMNMTTIATVFPRLEVMWLVDITDLEEIRDIDVLKNLKELRLKSLPALKHLRQIDSTPSQKNVVSIFNQLSCIYIYGCNELCNLFSLSAVTKSGSCLLQLERLVIESCGMMEQVFLWNEEERNIDITLVFPKLKFLSLISLPMLTSFCKGNESFVFPLLARMRITRCPLLVLGNFVSDDHDDDGRDDSIHLLSKPDKKKIELWINQLFGKVTNLSVEGDVDRNLDLQLPQNMRQLNFKEFPRGMKLVNMAAIATAFPLLEVLRLVKLTEIEKMEFDDLMTSNSLESLRELRFESLQALKHLWQSSSSPSQMNVGSIFNKLSSIYINGCNELCNLFSLSMIARDSCLLQLEKLEIESCEMMEQVFLWNEESEKQRIIHVGQFPKLNFLKLAFLPKLTDFCRGIKRIECPVLAKVKIVNCPQLRSSVYWNGKHSLIFNSSKSVQHQRAKDTNNAMQLSRPGTKEKGKRRLEDSTNEDSSYDLEKK